MPGTPVPDVTVVVPVYNAMPYLRACLDSLVAQTIGAHRLQVVAVDDGSTDGSGAVLDEYAARHPATVEVVHQENSGGPARPCNVGLAQARGRFVFFLGADDYLAPETFEHMVGAADRWESDVVCPKTIGTNGRVVLQDLFEQTVEDVPFPSRLLAHALSNTKLFRRSLLSEHGIDYPLDLRVGSDQPFTIAAMRHARKVSVLADEVYYYGVKREDRSNLTYRTAWRSRFTSIAAVMDWVAEQFPPGAERDTILHRHFHSELAKLMRREFPELDADEQRDLAAGIGERVATYLTPEIAAQLPVISRVRFRLAAAGRLDDLRVLAGAEDRPWPLVLSEPLRRGLPTWGSDPDDWFVAVEEPPRRLLARAVGPATILAVGDRARVEAETHLVPVRDGQVTLLLVASPNARSRPPRLVDDAFDPQRVVDVRIDGGRLTADVDLDLLRRSRRQPYAVRLAIELGHGTYTLPLKVAGVPGAGSGPDDRSALHVRPDPHGRALVELTEWHLAREETP